MLPFAKGLYDCSLPRKGVELVAVVAGTAGSLRLQPNEPIPSLNDDEAMVSDISEYVELSESRREVQICFVAAYFRTRGPETVQLPPKRRLEIYSAGADGG